MILAGDYHCFISLLDVCTGVKKGLQERLRGHVASNGRKVRPQLSTLAANLVTGRTSHGGSLVDLPPTLGRTRRQRIREKFATALGIHIGGERFKPSSRVEGTVIIELFEQWAPITTDNMIAHVESGLYDGIFFHRVIDDFVTQSGDPTCRALGAYPLTSPECGSGGTGETIPLEHDGNLSHVDGAIGMARSADPDSADSQWYIAETEAHGLDPENRDDEGYATFGIVRHGMSHIRSIALTPTTDDPTGSEDIQNPASSAGRPIYEAQVVSMVMIGVADPDGTIRTPVVESQGGGGWLQDIALVVGLPILVVLVGVGITMAVYTQQGNNPLTQAEGEPTVLEAEMVMVAELVEPETEVKDEG